MAQNLGLLLLFTLIAGGRVLCPIVLWPPILLCLCPSTQASLLFSRLWALALVLPSPGLPFPQILAWFAPSPLSGFAQSLTTPLKLHALPQAFLFLLPALLLFIALLNILYKSPTENEHSRVQGFCLFCSLP